MNIFRNVLLVASSAVLLAACQTSTPPRMTLNDAKKLAANVKKYEPKQLPRTISSYREINDGSVRAFGEKLFSGEGISGK